MASSTMIKDINRYMCRYSYLLYGCAITKDQYDANENYAWSILNNHYKLDQHGPPIFLPNAEFMDHDIKRGYVSIHEVSKCLRMRGIKWPEIIPTEGSGWWLVEAKYDTRESYPLEKFSCQLPVVSERSANSKDNGSMYKHQKNGKFHVQRKETLQQTSANANAAKEPCKGARE